MRLSSARENEREQAINNKVINENTLVITTLTTMISGLKSGAEKRMRNRNSNTVRMKIVTAARSMISGTELGLD
jgi:hypothetical protein